MNESNTNTPKIAETDQTPVEAQKKEKMGLMGKIGLGLGAAAAVLTLSVPDGAPKQVDNGANTTQVEPGTGVTPIQGIEPGTKLVLKTESASPAPKPEARVQAPAETSSNDDDQKQEVKKPRMPSEPTVTEPSEPTMPSEPTVTEPTTPETTPTEEPTANPTELPPIDDGHTGITPPPVTQ